MSDILTRLQVEHEREVADLLAELERTKAALDQTRVQLAGCSVAALGYAKGDNDCKPGDYGWSASFEDVKRLRARIHLLEAVAEAARHSPLSHAGWCVSKGSDPALRDGCTCGMSDLNRALAAFDAGKKEPLSKDPLLEEYRKDPDDRSPWALSRRWEKEK